VATNAPIQLVPVNQYLHLNTPPRTAKAHICRIFANLPEKLALLWTHSLAAVNVGHDSRRCGLNTPH